MGARQRALDSQPAAGPSPSLPRAISVLGPFENLNLALPFLFLIIGLVMAVKNPLTETGEVIWSFVVAYLFFDSTHVIFTAVFLAALPEARALMRDSLRQRKTWILFTGLLGLLVPTYFILKARHSLAPWMEDALFAIPLFLFYRHSLKQIFGISMLYNAHALKSPAVTEKAQVVQAEKRERFFLGLFVFGWVAYMFCKNTGLKALGLEQTSLLVSMALLVPLVWSIFQYRGTCWRNKKIYLARLALFPMAALTPLGLLGIGAVHGTEYLLVVWTLIRNSARAKKIFLILLLPIASTFLLLPRIIQNFAGDGLMFEGPYSGWSDFSKEFILISYMTVQYLHYYVDGLLFRLRDPLVRKHMGPLLGLR